MYKFLLKFLLIFIIVFIDLSFTQQPNQQQQNFQCPNNVQFESIVACDPEGINTCSLGFRCRPASIDGNNIPTAPALAPNITGPGMTANVTGKPLGEIRYMCCSSANMTISQYFIESGVSPTAAPIVPLAALKGVVMRDALTNQLASIDIVGTDFAPNIGLISSNFTLQEVGSFTLLDTVAFDFPPSEGGFLHFLVAIDPLLIPSAIFLYYNYPSFGTQIFNLTDAEQRFDRGYSEIIGNHTIPIETQYKQHFVILVFRTMQSMENATQVNNDLLQSQGDLAFFLSSTLTGETLDAPILGTLFRLRTPSTIFSTSNQTVTPGNNSMKNFDSKELITFLCFIQFLIVKLIFV